MGTRHTFLLLLIVPFLFFHSNIFAQQKDTTEKDFWQNLVSSNFEYNDSSIIKAHADELLNDLGISKNKDKIALVRKEREHYLVHNRTEQVKWFTQYELWLINLKTKHAVMLVKTNDKNFGIHHPTWSPDGKWIAFNTFSIEGHSPMTTGQTWIVDSSGNELLHLILPNPYNKFSNDIIKWEGRHLLIIKGVAMKFIDGKWNDLENKYSYDCESKIVKETK